MKFFFGCFFLFMVKFNVGRELCIIEIMIIYFGVLSYFVVVKYVIVGD